MQRREFEAIGTHWIIDLELPAKIHAEQLFTTVDQRIAQFDKDYSRFRSDSLVLRMAEQAGKYRLPADAQPIFDLYQKLYTVSAGALTPLIGQVLVDAGYDAAYSLEPKQLQRPPTWEEVLIYNYPHLTLHKPALLDVGAAGKGYLVDIVAEILREAGCKQFVIDAGGDIAVDVLASTPQRIGLEHPDDPSKAIGVVTVTKGSLCGSAGNRRSWEGFTHTIDPFTLASPRHLKATWVRAESTLLADGLATALSFVEPYVLQQHFSFEYVVMQANDSVIYSPGFGLELA